VTLSANHVSSVVVGDIMQWMQVYT